MRISNLLWYSMAIAAPVASQAGLFGWGSSNKKEEAKAPEPVAATVKTNNRFLHDMIHQERRYVLFNSRRLSGECRKYRTVDWSRMEFLLIIARMERMDFGIGFVPS